MNKIIKFLKKNILAIVLPLLMSCSSNTSQVIEPPLITPIEFSASPIDLQGIDAKFAKDIAYNTNERTKFDIFLPNTSQPTAIVLFIHGGGFVSGYKEIAYGAVRADDIRTYLRNNIAFATISYTFLEQTGETEGVLKPMNDVKRALQYIRSRAADFNLNKKVVLTGKSAGAGTSLWIAFHDDMRDVNNPDSVLRESTRVSGVAVHESQASYNVDRWINDVFTDYNLTLNDVASNSVLANKITRLYGIQSMDEYNLPQVQSYRKKVDMLAMFTQDDPEIWVSNIKQPVVYPTRSEVMVHHAFHARELKKRADVLGVNNVVYYGSNPLLYANPSNEDFTTFVVRKLNE
ncbi:MAG: alpha/beta hydrolase [Flavobacteriaceae bacterium]|nr:alpha/beta hydrolase [Flavobacteriaceae bacterium]